MGKKNLVGTIDVMLDETKILAHKFKTNRDGFHDFLDPATGIHLTFLCIDGYMSAHLTDESKAIGDPTRTIWSLRFSIEEIQRGFEKSFTKAHKRYYWNETVYVPSVEILNLIGNISESEAPNVQVNIFDLLVNMIDMVKQNRFFNKMKIKDAWNGGYRIGFQFSKTQQYVVFLEDTKYYYKFNIDPKKNFLRYSPFSMGIMEYDKRTKEAQDDIWKKSMSNENVRSSVKKLAAGIESDPEKIDSGLKAIDFV